MKLNKILKSLETILQWDDEEIKDNKKEFESLKTKLLKKRKNLTKKVKKCKDCKEKKELTKKLKAVKKLIKKLKKISL